MTWTVKISNSNREFVVDDGETVLTAALRQHVFLPYGCRDGACGSCRARLLEGKVNYPKGMPPALAQDTGDGVILCQAQPLSDLVIEAEVLDRVAGLEPRILPCRVTRLQRLAHDVMGVSLRLPKNQHLEFLAGQYIDILLSGNRHRSYSLANAPADEGDLELHIRKVEGGLFTTRLFKEMKEKELLRMRGPMGTFFLREGSGPVLLVAGGTGFAPMSSIIQQAIHDGSTRPIHLYWGVRSLHDLYCHELCTRWAARHDWLDYTPVLSEPQAEDGWRGATGWVHEAVVTNHADLAGFQVYAAGPPPMIHALRDAALAAGLDAANLFYDSFEYAGDHD